MTTTIPRGTHTRLASVEGDLEVKRDVTIEAEDKEIRVSGIVECEGDTEFKGSLTASRLEARDGRITVDGYLNIADRVDISDGSLEATRGIKARSINADRSLQVGENLEADTVEVGGRVVVKGQVIARKIDVGGAFECKSRVEIGEVEAGGHVIIDGEATLGRVDVGGSVKLAGGEVSDKIEVGGMLESSGPLKFNEIDVGGSILLTGSNRGGDIDVGGRVRVEGDLDFQAMDVGGRVELTGSGRGVSVEVGGRLEVGGNLTLSDRVEVGGGVNAGGELRARRMELNGTLQAKLAIIEESVEIGGRIETREGLKARRIETGSNWEARGPLIADRIELNRYSDVEDVYAVDLEMEDGAKARNVYAQHMRIGNDCRISGVIEYTDSIEVGRNLDAGQGMPRKVESLPKFPLS